MLPREPVATHLGISRRHFLQHAGGGLGALALQWLLQEQPASAADPLVGPLGTKKSHFPPKARSVIYLFMHGGPSHLETFDPKPDLQRLAGQPLPASFGPVATRRKVAHNPLLRHAADVSQVRPERDRDLRLPARPRANAPTTWP